MLNRNSALRSLLVFQAIGFAVQIALIWADEAFDLANTVFGQPKVPFNYIEAFSESAIALTLGALVLWYTARLVSHIKYLEGLISLCAYCHKVHLDGKWLPLEDFLSSRSEASFSHGFCPECTATHYGKYMPETGPRNDASAPREAKNPAHSLL